MIYNRRLMAIEVWWLLVDGRISYFSVLQLLRSTVGFSDTSSNNANHNNLYFFSDYQVYHLSLSTYTHLTYSHHHYFSLLPVCRGIIQAGTRLLLSYRPGIYPQYLDRRSVMGELLVGRRVSPGSDLARSSYRLDHDNTDFRCYSQTTDGFICEGE